MELYLVRHGETEMNRVDVFRGRSDPRLTKRGSSRRERSGKAWPASIFEAFYASPLKRSMQTAQAIADRHVSEVRPFPPSSTSTMVNGAARAWRRCVPAGRASSPSGRRAPREVVFPGGESLAGAYARLSEGLAGLRQDYAQLVLVVGHKVVNRLILCICLGLGPEGMWRLDQSNGALNVVESRGESWMVKRLNDVGHLSSCMSRDQLT